MRCLPVAMIFLFSALTVLGRSHGDVIQYSDRTTFSAQGTILYSNDFEDLGFPDAGGGLASPGTPWMIQGVTYNGTNVIVLASSTLYHPLSDVFVDSYGPISASMTGTAACNMLAMDVAALLTPGSSDFLRLNTNLRVYDFDLSDLPVVSAGQTFLGFTTDSRLEYFVSFQLRGDCYPTIDNVTLGYAVPEPATAAIMAAFLPALWAAVGLRRRRRALESV